MKKYLKEIIGMSFFLLSASVFASNDAYVIFVDAGSSGSRLHLFDYNKTQSIPDINDIFSESTKPGLSSFAAHPDQAGASLQKLLDDTMQFLQKESIDPKNISVNVLGTGGMRLLPMKTQKAIYASVANYIQKHTVFSVSDVETISGKKEGLYGWLDVNYLLGNFQQNKPTVGSIDMGGASTQIAFETHDPKWLKDEISFDLGQQHYTVFSKSFLGLGQDQARLAMNADVNAMTCYPLNDPFSKKESGDFNFTPCSTVYHQVIQQHTVQKSIPSLQGKSFIAYSGMYYTYHFFNADKTPNAAYLLAQMTNVCGESWEELQKNYPKVPLQYLSSYCANGVYSYALMYDTYQLQGTQLTVLDQLNYQDIDWPLGAVVSQFTHQP